MNSPEAKKELNAMNISELSYVSLYFLFFFASVWHIL